MSVFPGSLPPASSANTGDTLAVAGHTALHNNDRDEIRALATKTGTGASTPTSGMLLRGNGSGTSVWGQVNLTTDVTGVLPVANGGNGTTSTTGTGSAVFDTSPTLTTPVIGDFTNATHTHTNNAGGGQLGSSALQTNAVQANQIATSAITLGYAQSTTSFSTTNTSATQVTSLTITVTIPAGGRRIKITAYGSDLYISGASNNGAYMTIWDGVVGSGTQLTRTTGGANSGSAAPGGLAIAVVTPSAGSKTYNIGLHAQAAGTANIDADPTYPSFILVEVI